VIAFHCRPVALGAPQLGLHLRQLPLGERQLFALRGQFSLQHGNPLAVFGREAFGNRDGFLILDFAGEPAPPFGVRQSLTLGSELPVRARNGFLNLGDGNLRVDDGFSHLARERAQVGPSRAGGGIQGRAERVPQALEQRSALPDRLREE
jgi:hypothetical protein